MLRVVIKNAFITFVGLVIPQGVALAVIPFLAHSLGTDRFGLFMLIVTILGNFALLDFGISRATTKLVSECHELKDSEACSGIVWTAAFVQGSIATLAGACLFAGSSEFVNLIHPNGPLTQEAIGSVKLLSALMPIVVASFAFKGGLEAYHRFGVVSIVKGVFQSLGFLLPAGVIILGGEFIAVIVSTAIAWSAMGLAYAMAAIRLIGLPMSFMLKGDVVMRILSYGGWVALSGMVAPFLLYCDRFVISSFRSLSDVTYYVIPYEVISRLQIIPVSLTTAMFPAISRMHPRAGLIGRQLYYQCLRRLSAVMIPFTIAAILVGPKAVQLWIGNGLPVDSAAVLQILGVGVLFNALAQVPANYLDAIGRPDLRAKVFLSYLFPYLALVGYLVWAFGIRGAAIAWTVRSVTEFAIFHVVWRNQGLCPDFRWRARRRFR